MAAYFFGCQRDRKDAPETENKDETGERFASGGLGKSG